MLFLRIQQINLSLLWTGYNYFQRITNEILKIRSRTQIFKHSGFFLVLVSEFICLRVAFADLPRKKADKSLDGINGGGT